VETGELEIVVRLHSVWVEEGTVVLPNALWGRQFERRRCFDGLQALRIREASLILRRGSHGVAAFKAPPGRYVQLADLDRPFLLKVPDLLVTSAEMERFDKINGPFPRPKTHAAASLRIRHIGDCTEVEVGGEVLRFRGVQAAIIRELHRRALDGNPWVHGKELLRAVNAYSRRLVDVFKRNPYWRRVVESDRCGAYRLKDLRSPE
jgi:hypothetical protein